MTRSNQNPDTTIKRVLLKIVRPLVRVLLDKNVTFKDLTEVLKHAYVDEIKARGERDGKTPKIGYIAAKSGIQRNEVGRILKSSWSDETFSSRTHNRLEAVVNGWVIDPLYHDEKGAPAPLPYLGEGITFKSLADKYSRGIAHATVLESLKNEAVVKEIGDTIYLLNPLYAEPISQSDIEALTDFASNAEDFISTLRYNLNRSETQPSRFQQTISLPMREQDRRDFKRFVVSELKCFWPKIYDYLTTLKKRYDREAENDIHISGNSTEHSVPAEHKYRCGVGFYIYDQGDDYDQSSSESSIREDGHSEGNTL